ncbi:dihydrolipoyl dehydrogenase [Gorillibacterium timonense]|uniref:dihydrolipoyl dehydrogenase n=1 Tax=Gorillibacterium timonense TaxID=1689269 RepID=UPI00071D93F6|nr:dihydrolipoyl dehydrogenase [Gorillibacterium timonense]
MSKSYEIVVLGGGVGGYTAAIRAAQLGKSVALVEKEKLGGTCLHRGCIPTKALLRSAEVYAEFHEAEDYGIEAEAFRVNMGKVQERKNRIVEQLHKGVQFLMKKNKIDVYAGMGRLIGPSIFSPRAGSVAVELADGETETLVPEHLILATGSRPRSLPGLVPDGKRILTSDEALELPEIPRSVIIIGGGVIGCEFASLLSDMGAEVTMVEYADRLLPMEDKDISAELARRFKKDGIRVLTGARVLPETVSADEREVRLNAEQSSGTVELTADIAIVAVGRIANTEGIGLENTDIVLDRGFIRTDDYLQTAENHIYAVGDVNGKMQLAHAAAHQAVAAVERIAGMAAHPFRVQEVPRCVYTRLQVASLGISEQEAKDAGRSVKIGKFPFKALGKALVQGETGGFVKVVADRESDDILGVHMIGGHVTELIGEASLAGFLNASAWEAGQAIHPHPTLSEALAEAMLAVDGKALNL